MRCFPNYSLQEMYDAFKAAMYYNFRIYEDESSFKNRVFHCFKDYYIKEYPEKDFTKLKNIKK